MIEGVPRGEKIIIGNDLHGHGHVDKEVKGYKDVHESYRFGERNNESKDIIDFITTHELIIADTQFKKLEDELVTYKTGSSTTQVNYFPQDENRLMLEGL